MKRLIFLVAICGLLFTSCENSKPNDSNPKFDSGKAVIEPTFQQAIYYSNLSGNPAKYAGWAILALGMGAIVFALAKDKIEMGKGPAAGMFIILCAFLACLYVKPSQIWLNNKKYPDANYYNKVVQDEGSSKPIWDSVYHSNLMIGAPVKK